MASYNLDDKVLDVYKLARDALIDENLFMELLNGVKSKDNTIRSNSFRSLLIISEENPEFIYPQWNYFLDMLRSTNNYHRYIAIYILANLTRADKEKRFDGIFDEYYAILGDDKVMTASHVAANSPTISKNKPELKSKIIEKLINIDTIHQGKHKELIKAYAIESLRKIYPDADDKEEVIEFVKAQLNSPSPKTRDMAVCFLDRC